MYESRLFTATSCFFMIYCIPFMRDLTTESLGRGMTIDSIRFLPRINSAVSVASFTEATSPPSTKYDFPFIPCPVTSRKSCTLECLIALSAATTPDVKVGVRHWK